MKTLIFVTAIFAIGCNVEPAVCTTQCGLRLATKNTWTCEQLQHAENVAVDQLSQVSDPRFTREKICSAFKGWNIEVKDVPFWVDGKDPLSGDPATVSGLTHCEFGFVELGSGAPLEHSFCHEMAHVVQNCQVLPGPCLNSNPHALNYGQPDDDPNHTCWTRDGEWVAAQRCKDIGAAERLDGGTI